LHNEKIFTNKKFVASIATLCCLLWGSAYPAIKSGYILFNIGAYDVSSKIVFAGYRFTMAGLLVLIIAKLFGQNLFTFSKKSFLSLVMLGIIQTTLQYIFFYIGLANTTGVKGSIMNSMGTFFSVFLAHYIYKNDKLNLQKVSGCIVGFIGVMIVNFSADLLNFSFNFKGEGFVIISSLMFSLAAIYGKKLTQSMDVMVVTGYSLFIGGALLTILGMSFGGSVHNFTLSSSLLLSYMILLSSVAFTLWSLLLKYNKVGSVSVFIFLIPIFGVILSAIFLGENILEMKNVFALMLVCMGIWMVNKEKKIKISTLVVTKAVE
jgi:drug/metabolite transporter (DMT)-like permease